MIETKEATLEEVSEYLKTVGKRGAYTMQQLGRISTFLSAWNSESGKQLLQMEVGHLKFLGDKLWDGTITEEEKALFKVRKQNVEHIANLMRMKELHVNRVKHKIGGE